MFITVCSSGETALVRPIAIAVISSGHCVFEKHLTEVQYASNKTSEWPIKQVRSKQTAVQQCTSREESRPGRSCMDQPLLSCVEGMRAVLQVNTAKEHYFLRDFHVRKWNDWAREDVEYGPSLDSLGPTRLAQRTSNGAKICKTLC